MRLGRQQRGRGRGRGQGPPQQQAAALLRVTVHLDAEKRGWVIGAQGATVKATQRATGARISLPQRGVDGPTNVEGPTPLSVLRACALIARQAAAECQCTCSLAGSTEIRATLHPTGADADAHRLFELTADSAVAFVAYVLPVSPAGQGYPAGHAAEVLAACWLDDAIFSAGAGAMALELRRTCWAERTGDELYLYGMGDGAELVRRCHAALAAGMMILRTEEAAAALPPTPSAPPSEAEQLRRAMRGQPGTWHAVSLWGELARGGAHHSMLEA